MHVKKQKKHHSVHEQKCLNGADKVINFDRLPRILDTFWRKDTKMPSCRMSGLKMLRIASLNKSSAFSHRERQLYNIHGLLPVAVRSIDRQVEACSKYLATLTTYYQKHIFLTELETHDRKLFYSMLMSNPEKYLSVYHSSSAKDSVIHYSHLFTKCKGMFVTIKDRGHVLQVLSNWPHRHAVRYLIVTNGEVVLNMGDHGVNGYPMVFSKLHQSVVYGRVPPETCLPIMLDCGTNNEHLLQDPLYVGWPHRRITGPEYESFFEEFMLAVMRLFGPRTLIQTKNFNIKDSIKQLELYRKRQCIMDIDLQCLGACGLAGLLVANRISNRKLTDNTILLYGYGAFNVGMAYTCLAQLKHMRLDESAARDRIWFCDDKGLVVHSRCDDTVPVHLLKFVKRHEPISSLCEAIEAIKPNVLVGCSKQPNVFSKEVIKAMEQSCKQPIIYSMTRQSELAECSANDAFVYTKGRCIFISASELPPLKYANKWYQPGYCNVNYMLPGLTLGVMLSGMTSVPDDTFLVAAQRLANLVWPNDLEMRNCFPPIRKLKCINQQITDTVFSYAYRRRIATLWPEPSNPTSYIESMMYQTDYGPEISQIYCTAKQNIGTAESATYYKQNI
ncbi:NADP-dependent malic enzyme [Drosophila grimshawi]|uniref:GH20645 n=1 Tax=Drosophila grimshawi TaxID=7222 RepID=B4J7G1_DROGR|nr:NADP-dependent malic enzyme [Drosophila grimshawi]EDW01085.1 GH20645 [Drosophila grimshawi]